MVGLMLVIAHFDYGRVCIRFLVAFQQGKVRKSLQTHHIFSAS
jgi:hypothetical protein